MCVCVCVCVCAHIYICVFAKNGRDMTDNKKENYQRRFLWRREREQDQPRTVYSLDN